MDTNSGFQKPSFDKANFVIGLSAAVLALYPFKDISSNVKAIFFGHEISLFSLSGIFLILLFVSIYFYGLNNLRYHSEELLTNDRYKSLKILEVIANGAYLLAFLLPILAIFVWLISSGLNYISPFISKLSSVKINSSAISDLVSGVGSFIAVLYSFFSYKRIKGIRLTNLKQDAAASLSDAENPRTGEVVLTIINLYEALILTLKSFLVDRIGLSSDRLNSAGIIGLSQKLKILSDEEVAFVRDLRGIRNYIAHSSSPSSINISYEQVKEFRRKIEPIIRRISAMSEK